MAVTCTMTLSFANQETRAQEVLLIERAARIAAGDIRRHGGGGADGGVGTIIDATFGSMGAWTYAAGASK
jgi:hypothetical protein